MRSMFLFVLVMAFAGCTKTSVEDFELIEDELGSDQSPYYGRWERVVGANGDYTEIAIGGITGEASNRVYMCEKNGSVAGLYKGYISGNTITWDVTYGVPDFMLSIESGDLVVNVPACGACLPTYYFEDPWDGECGPL